MSSPVPAPLYVHPPVAPCLPSTLVHTSPIHERHCSLSLAGHPSTIPPSPLSFACCPSVNTMATVPSHCTLPTHPLSFACHPSVNTTATIPSHCMSPTCDPTVLTLPIHPWHHTRHPLSFARRLPMSPCLPAPLVCMMLPIRDTTATVPTHLQVTHP